MSNLVSRFTCKRAKAKRAKAKNSKDLEIAQRRSQVAKLYVQRLSQQEIAKALGVNQATVSRDVAAVKKAHLDAAKSSLDDMIARELAELDDMEGQCALMFLTNKHDVWIGRRLQIKERRAKMLGLDAPEKRDLSGEVKLDHGLDPIEEFLRRLNAYAALGEAKGTTDESSS